MSRRIRVHWVVAALVAVFLVEAVGVTPAPISAATSPSAGPAQSQAHADDPVTDSDLEAADEVIGKRTESSRTFDLGRGRFATEFFADAIFHEPRGKGTGFVPIEPRFVPVAGPDESVVSGDAPTEVSVAPAQDPDGFLSVADENDFRVSLRPLHILQPPGPAAGEDEPKIVGEIRADVAQVFPKVDARVFAHGDGARLFLVLEEVPLVSAWTFALNLPKGASARLDARTGGVDILDATGVRRMRMPAPYAVDSTPDEFTGSGEMTTDLSYTLGEHQGSTTVTVGFNDPSWLADAVYPVYVDPTIYNDGTTTYGDAHVNQGNPTFNYANYLRPDAPGYYEMWLGESPSQSTYYNEAYIKFNLATLAGKAIDTATMEVRPYHQYYNSPTATNTWLRRVVNDGTWAENTINWNSRPNVTTPTVIEGCVEGQQCSFDILTIARGWIDGTYTNNGVRLDENGNGPTYWKRLIASEEQTTTRPRLLVTYHEPVSVLYPSGGGPTSSRTLAWDFNGPVAQTHYQVDVATDAGFSSIVATSGDVTSASDYWAIPTTTTLTTGTTYHWRVRVRFGASAWSAYTTAAAFVHDATANLGQQSQHTFESWDLGGGDDLSVNVGTGNLVIQHPIVELPVRGSSVDINLTYNRHDTSSVGMGPGWRLNMHRRLIDLGGGKVQFIAGDGSRHTFDDISTVGTVTTYTRPATLYATLVKDTSVTANEYILTYRDLSKDKFDILGSEGLLVREEDRFGNGVGLTYVAGTSRISKIRDTAASPVREIDFGYDASNRVTSITDWAWVSGGVVQETATGARRVNRFFYDGSGNLAGWADALNTTGSCPTGGSHLTCITYPTNQLDITKTQTYTTIGGSPAALGSATRTATTRVTFSGSDVANVKDAEEVNAASAGTAFTHVNPAQTQVVRRGNGSASLDTTTRYTLVAGTDPYARIGSVKRKLGANWIERLTSFDATYPIEPASVTDNNGALLSTPARTTSYTYVASSLGLVSRMVEPLDGTYSRWTDYTYNANNDVTQTIVSRQGDATLRTTTRNCYTTQSLTCALTETGLSVVRQIDNWKSGAASDENTMVATDFTYDAYGQQTRLTRHNRGFAGGVIDDRADGSVYDDKGNLTASITNYVNGTVTGPTGDDITPNAITGARTDLTTTYTYDTAGNQLSVADPRRAIEAAKGISLGSDDFIGRNSYDPLNQRLTEKTPTTPGITITCAATSPNCRDSSMTYDEFGAVRSSTDFGNLITATAFDRAGRSVAGYEDPPDVGGSKPATTTSQTTYDPSGRVLISKDQIQVVDATRGYTLNAYDELGRVIAVADAVGTAAAVETDTTYDALDRVLTTFFGVTGGADTYQITTTRYDLGGRATETDDEFTCARSTYDYRDVVTSTREGLTPGATACTGTGTRLITNTHDNLERLTKSEVTEGQGMGDILAQDTFDSAGNKLSSSAHVAATSTTTTVTYAVNLLDQTLSEARTDGSVAKSLYDPVGNATERCYWATAPVPAEPCKPVGSSFTTVPTRHTSATFDARNNRATLKDGSTNALTIYDPDHNYQTQAVYVPTKMTGSTIDVESQSLFTYDERHRLVSISHQTCTVSSQTTHACSATTSIGSVAYEYDGNDNRTRVNENNGASSADRRYCYDAQDRLQYRNTGAACSSTAKDESYAFDGAGNRTQTVLGAITTNFAYDAQGQLCKVGATTCGTPNVTYDAAGRTSTYNGWWFTYDAEGRLLTACKSATCAATADKVTMTYDGEGRRTKIATKPANLAETVREFRYQGDAIVEEKVGGVVARQYLVDESGSVVEMIIPSGGNAGTYVVTWTGHGDAMALWRVKSDGSLERANTFSYSTWGAPTITGTYPNSANANADYGDLGFRFLYVGEFDVQWDDAFGLDLTYMHARHYSPALGRFIQPDPDRSEANLYAYAANNPVTEIDPDGTCFIVCNIVIGAVIDAVVYVATTDNANLGGLAHAVAGGAVESAINPFSKIGKASKLLTAGKKIYSKISKASRVRAKIKHARPDAIVRLASMRVSRRGAAPLTRNFSAAQSRAARKYPALRSAYKGTQYHNDVADEVRRIAGRRLQYNRRGPDFLDRRTGTRVELTTRGQLSRHYARPGYGRPSPMMRYVRYRLP